MMMKKAGKTPVSSGAARPADCADGEFDARLAAHGDELRSLYLSLYHGDEAAWDYFVSMLRRSWSERSESLRALDRGRLQDPEWYRGHSLTGMLMYVDAFAGTISGVLRKLDYIRDCGVNYLHLMPLLESPEGRSDGGYAVSDFRRVQPSLGRNGGPGGPGGRVPHPRHRPLPGLCHEPHQRRPPLGHVRQGRRPGIPGAVFLLRQLGDPQPL